MNKDIAEVIGDIGKVSCLINLQGKHHVFVEDSGHVTQLSIRLHVGGWKSHVDPTLTQDIYYGQANSSKTLKDLKKARDLLHKIYKNGKINMKNCNYEIEEIKHYKFC